MDLDGWDVAGNPDPLEPDVTGDLGGGAVALVHETMIAAPTVTAASNRLRGEAAELVDTGRPLGRVDARPSGVGLAIGGARCWRPY
jgi:hypothetical protein